MYGWINECIESLVIEKFGRSAWDSIVKELGDDADTDFVRYEYYKDSDTFKLVEIICNSCGIEADALLEMFGCHFIQFTRTQGYDNLLNCLGSTLMEWLSNVDTLHRLLSSNLPKMRAPHFRCTTDREHPNCILLYYQSLRGAGLEPIVVGIVKEVAKANFGMIVQLDQISTQNVENCVEYSCWRISVEAEVIDGNLVNMSSPPLDFGETVVNLPQKCPFSRSSSMKGDEKISTVETDGRNFQKVGCGDMSQNDTRAAIDCNWSDTRTSMSSSSGLKYRRIKLSSRLSGAERREILERLQVDRKACDRDQAALNESLNSLSSTPTQLKPHCLTIPKHVYGYPPVTGERRGQKVKAKSRRNASKLATFWTKLLKRDRKTRVGNSNSPSPSLGTRNNIFCPDDLTAVAPNSNGYGLSKEMLCDLYPYHVVFNSSMAILQSGHLLDKFIGKSLLQGKMHDFFTVKNSFYFKKKGDWAQFIFDTEDNSATMYVKDRRDGAEECLCLIGPVIFTENASVAIFLGAPNVTSLRDLNKQGLAVSDIPTNDIHLKMILLSEHLSSETESSYRLARLSRELESERGKRMAAMEEAAKHAESALATKKTFVRYVSHEIRTPLTISKVGIDLVLDDLKQLGASESCLSTAVQCQESMDVAVSILNDLLTYEKLEGGIMELYRTFVAAKPFIVRTLKPFNVYAKQKSIDFSVVLDLDTSQLSSSFKVTADDLLALIDTTKMSQVIRNLASNALKFTPIGGKVTVVVTLSDKKEMLLSSKPLKSRGLERGTSCITENLASAERCGTLLLKVIDNGAGIRKFDQPQIFNEIVQFSPNELQAGGGSGLGLWISKRICDLHDCKILMMSEGLGTGSTFTVEMPIYVDTVNMSHEACSLDNPLETRQTPTGELLASSNCSSLDRDQSSMSDDDYLAVLSGLNILLVDDAKMILKVVSRLLQTKKATCTLAEDGKQAIDAVTSADKPFDVILMDSVMPVCAGPEATTKIRDLGYNGIILGVTGNVMPQDVRLFLEAGADVILGKPLDIVELGKTLHGILKSKSSKIFPQSLSDLNA